MSHGYKIPVNWIERFLEDIHTADESESAGRKDCKQGKYPQKIHCETHFFCVFSNFTLINDNLLVNLWEESQSRNKFFCFQSNNLMTQSQDMKLSKFESVFENEFLK